MASAAAKSREVKLLEKLRIIGEMVWNSAPPKTRGTAIAPNPPRKVSTVMENSVGFNTGSTIRFKIVQVEAPIGSFNRLMVDLLHRRAHK